MKRDRIDHHSRLEPLDLPHLVGLRGGIEILVDHAHAAGLRHRNSELRFGDRIHRR